MKNRRPDSLPEGKNSPKYLGLQPLEWLAGALGIALVTTSLQLAFPQREKRPPLPPKAKEPTVPSSSQPRVETQSLPPHQLTEAQRQRFQHYFQLSRRHEGHHQMILANGYELHYGSDQVNGFILNKSSEHMVQIHPKKGKVFESIMTFSMDEEGQIIAHTTMVPKNDIMSVEEFLACLEEWEQRLSPSFDSD